VTPTRAQREPTPAVAAVVDGPWDLADLVSLAGRVLLAFAGIVVAWEGASRTLVWNSQQAWTALGIGSLVFGLMGVLGWLRAGIVRIRDAKYEVLASLTPATSDASVSTAPVEPWATSRSLTRGAHVVRGDGMSLFHRPECIFVKDKAVRSSSRADAERDGAAPCVVCQP
jgi:hypothetical protein